MRPKHHSSNIDKLNNGTCVLKGKRNSTNALGMVGKPSLAVQRFPYLLDSCDQVILVPGFLIQANNYFANKPAFLTLSTYYANVFEKKNSDNLIKSISLDKISQIPQPIKGAPVCTSIKSELDEINFCFKNQKILNNILQSFKDLLACRKGMAITKGK